MKVVTSQQMRELDRRTIQDRGVSGAVLMGRAGAAVAEAVTELANLRGWPSPVVRCVAGKGNNGGDAFGAAARLRDNGCDVEVLLAGTVSDVQGDALKYLEDVRCLEVPLIELPSADDWRSASCEEFLSGAQVVVDGLLGTGFGGLPRDPVAAAIRRIRECSGRAAVVAVDVPSGLDADTGECRGEAVVADVTVTLGLPKRGLVQPCALEHVGSVRVADIGIPPDLVTEYDPEVEFIAAADVAGWFGRRPRRSHKGTYGKVLVVGGSVGYAGAAALAIDGAVRSGAGLVTALVPASVQPTVSGLASEAMVHPGKETSRGSLAGDSIRAWGRSLEEFDAILVGPGLTAGDDSRQVVESIVAGARGAVVVDADGLNVAAGAPGLLDRAAGRLVLTPHPGEMARLLGGTADSVEQDRAKAARDAARRFRCVAVLKGAGTLVAAPARPLFVNLTGNPGMAKGGMGDVLGGLLAGTVAQGLEIQPAACAAVYMHGRAGDLAAWRGSQRGVSAWDVVAEIPGVFREVTFR